MVPRCAHTWRTVPKAAQTVTWYGEGYDVEYSERIVASLQVDGGFAASGSRPLKRFSFHLSKPQLLLDSTRQISLSSGPTARRFELRRPLLASVIDLFT